MGRNCRIPVRGKYSNLLVIQELEKPDPLICQFRVWQIPKYGTKKIREAPQTPLFFFHNIQDYEIEISFLLIKNKKYFYEEIWGKSCIFYKFFLI